MAIKVPPTHVSLTPYSLPPQMVLDKQRRDAEATASRREVTVAFDVEALNKLRAIGDKLRITDHILHTVSLAELIRSAVRVLNDALEPCLDMSNDDPTQYLRFGPKELVPFDVILTRHTYAFVKEVEARFPCEGNPYKRGHKALLTEALRIGGSFVHDKTVNPFEFLQSFSPNPHLLATRPVSTDYHHVSVRLTIPKLLADLLYGFHLICRTGWNHLSRTVIDNEPTYFGQLCFAGLIYYFQSPSMTAGIVLDAVMNNMLERNDLLRSYMNIGDQEAVDSLHHFYDPRIDTVEAVAPDDLRWEPLAP